MVVEEEEEEELLLLLLLHLLLAGEGAEAAPLQCCLTHSWP